MLNKQIGQKYNGAGVNPGLEASGKCPALPLKDWAGQRTAFLFGAPPAHLSHLTNLLRSALDVIPKPTSCLLVCSPLCPLHCDPAQSPCRAPAGRHHQRRLLQVACVTLSGSASLGLR